MNVYSEYFDNSFIGEYQRDKVNEKTKYKDLLIFSICSINSMTLIHLHFLISMRTMKSRIVKVDSSVASPRNCQSKQTVHFSTIQSSAFIRPFSLLNRLGPSTIELEEYKKSVLGFLGKASEIDISVAK